MVVHPIAQSTLSYPASVLCIIFQKGLIISHITEETARIRRGFNMEKYKSGAELPVGLGLALEEYQAMDYFFSLAPQAQQQIIDHTHSIQSKAEMLAYVQSIIPAK